MFQKDHDTVGVRFIDRIHGGKGVTAVKSFKFEGEPSPAHFLIYDFPPGSSEGVHVHDQSNGGGEGAYDEYYYVISGEGQMEIDGEIMPVRQGDHIHTPLGVFHGIENTSSSEHLRVFLTYISRDRENV